MWRYEDSFKALLAASEKKLSKSLLDEVVDIAVKEAKEGYKSVCALLERQMKSSKPKGLLNMLYIMSAICRKSKQKYGTKDRYGLRFEPRLETIAGYIARVPEEDRAGVAKVVQSWKREAIFSPNGLLWFQAFTLPAKATSSEQLSLATPGELLKEEPTGAAPLIEHDFGDEFSEPSAGSVGELPPPPPILASVTNTATRLTPGAATLSTGSTKQADVRPTYKYTHAASSASSPTSADPPSAPGLPPPPQQPPRKRSRWDTPKAAVTNLPDMEIDVPVQQPAAPAEPALPPPPPPPLPRPPPSTPATAHNGGPAWPAAIPAPPQHAPAIQGWSNQPYASQALQPPQPPQGAYSQPQGLYSQPQGPHSQPQGPHSQPQGPYSQPQGPYSQTHGYVPQWRPPSHQRPHWPPAPRPPPYTPPVRSASQAGANVLADALAMARSAALALKGPQPAPPQPPANSTAVTPAPSVPEMPAVLEIPSELDVAAELRGALESAATEVQKQLQYPTVWPQGHDEDVLAPPPPPPRPPNSSTITVNMVATPESGNRWSQPADKSGPVGAMQPSDGVVSMQVLDTVCEQPSASDTQAKLTLVSPGIADPAGGAELASSAAVGQLHNAAHAGAVQQSEPVVDNMEKLAATGRDAALLHEEARQPMTEIGTILKEPSSVNGQPNTATGTGNAAAVRGLQEDVSTAGCSPPPPPDKSGAAEVSSPASGAAPEQGKEPSSPVGPRIGSPDWSSLGSLVGPNDRALLDTPLSRLQQPAGQLSLLLPGDGTIGVQSRANH